MKKEDCFFDVNTKFNFSIDYPYSIFYHAFQRTIENSEVNVVGKFFDQGEFYQGELQEGNFFISKKSKMFDKRSMPYIQFEGSVIGILDKSEFKGRVKYNRWSIGVFLSFILIMEIGFLLNIKGLDFWVGQTMLVISFFVVRYFAFVSLKKALKTFEEDMNRAGRSY